MTAITPIDDAGRNALAREWLGANVDGVDLFIETYDCTDHTSCPGFVRVRVDANFLTAIQRRNAFCIADDLVSPLTQTFPFGPNAKVRNLFGMGEKADVVEEWYLCVDQSEFFFEGKADGEVLTNSQSILVSQLGFWLQGKPELQDCDPVELEVDCFRWHGGALFYADHDMDDLIGNVLSEHPEVAARQVAIEMEARIRDADLNLAPKVTSRRRKTAGL